MTVMAMPETTIHKDDGLVSGQNYVGLSWESSVVQPISKTAFVEACANYYLRFGVLACNPGHHSRAGGFVYGIGHVIIKSLNLLVAPGSITSINLKRVAGGIKSISH